MESKNKHFYFFLAKMPNSDILRSVPALQELNQAKRTICIFHQKGNCNRGAQCPFKHVTFDLQMQQARNGVRGTIFRWITGGDRGQFGFIEAVDESGNRTEYYCHERRLDDPPDRIVPPIEVRFDTSPAHKEGRLDDAINVKILSTSALT